MCGGETLNPNPPDCVFGDFGVIMNEVGDCAKPCLPGKFAVQVSYSTGTICCCN